MPVQADFSVVKFEDGTLAVTMSPPVAIGGRTIQCVFTKYFGGTSGLIQKSSASGIPNGASGITITDSGAGKFQVTINSTDTSGLNPGNYSYSVCLTDTPYTEVAFGYLLLAPSIRNF